MKTKSELKRDLLAQVKSEPGIKAANLKVSVKNGVVTLKGSVSSYAEKLAAVKAVKGLKGVTGLVDNVVVDIPSSQQRTDAEIAGEASNAIRCITTVPAETIKVTARGGRLILEGALEDWHEREAAEDAVHHLTGVIGVTNLITVKSALPTDLGGAVKATAGEDAERAAGRAEGETAVVLPPLENCEVKASIVPPAQPALL